MSAEGRGTEVDGRSPSVPRTALLVIADDRWDYLDRTVASAVENLNGQFSSVVLILDNGGCWPSDISQTYKALETLAPLTVDWSRERRGIAGSIGAGWDALPKNTDYVFHLEQDFTFPEPVDVGEMVRHLEADPKLAQVALFRQPWSPEEHAAGSIFNLYRPDFTQSGGLIHHRRLFTFNPCVYPTTVCDYGAGLEREVTDTLLGAGFHFAYLGRGDDPPRCVHIGERRSAGYRW